MAEKRPNFWQRVRQAFGAPQDDGRVRALVRQRASEKLPRKALVGGRPTVDAGAYDLEYTLWGLVNRRTALSAASLQMMRSMRDYNPDAALALWNMIRLATKIEDIQVYHYAPDLTEDEWDTDLEGQQRIRELDERQIVGGEYGGGLRAIAGVLVLTLMTQGAAALEVALTDDLRDVEDFCPVDPWLVTFQRDERRVARPVLNLIHGAPVPLNEVQFRYVPLDPEVNDPHGRSPMWPALEAVMFQTEVLRDLKAVAHNQGYPRIDVSVVEEIVIQNLPPHLKGPGQEDDLKDWLDGYLTDIASAYEALNPDDAFVHWDWLQVNMTGPGKGGAGSLDIQALIRVVEAQVIAALKSLPILLGRNEGTTTTHATVQWQIYADSVEAVQDVVQKMLEWACNLTLRVWGRQSVCRITMERPRKSDRYQEAQADQIEADTWFKKVLYGWATNDEAAQATVGHDAVGEMALPQSPPQEEPEPQGDDEPADAGRGRRAARQDTAPAWNAEMAEWALVPQWMQALRRERERSVAQLERDQWLRGREALAAISDEEWQEAEEADAAAGRKNGHGGRR